jgi:hypothetical protein
MNNADVILYEINYSPFIPLNTLHVIYYFGIKS